MALVAELERRAGWAGIMAARYLIEIDASRVDAFEMAVGSFAKSIGETSESLMALAVRQQLPAASWGRLLHLATNHETKFFRYIPAINLIVSLAGVLAEPRIVSVGCSTGEEPYSIATSLKRAGIDRFAVHGTDISETCIQHGKAGIYSPHPEIGSDVAVCIGGGKVKFRDDILQKVSFEQHNVVGEAPFDFARPDIIVTQNMLIYYQVPTRHLILFRLASMLPIGGFLITGPVEDAGWKAHGIKRVPNPYASLFQKV